MYYDEPMYQKLKDDQLLAWCDWKKFKALAYEDQLRTVREEVYVIALERYIFPGITRGIPPQADQAFFKAMEIICTRLWTGKWAWFAINNFWEIVNYEVDYLSKVSHLIKIVEDKS